MRWILNCFWPFHQKNYGNRHALLLLDNFSAHTKVMDDPRIPTKLHILFFPPNSTSFLQPADMGMIASLKVGYWMKMLELLLTICKNSPAAYENAVRVGRTMGRGCKGLYHGTKANVLDALLILKDLWDNDEKYCRIEGIQRCWKKANVLPPTLAADLNNKIEPRKGNTASKKQNEDDDVGKDLSLMFSNLFLKARNMNATDGNPSMIPEVFTDTIVADSIEPNSKELLEIVDKWANIEDDEEIVFCEIEEMIEENETLIRTKKEMEVDCAEDMDSSSPDEMVKSDNAVVTLHNNDELWLDVEKGMRSLKQLIQNENLGDGVNTKVDRLMNDIHRLRISAKIEKKSCQESITRFIDNN